MQVVWVGPASIRQPGRDVFVVRTVRIIWKSIQSVRAARVFLRNLTGLASVFILLGCGHSHLFPACSALGFLRGRHCSPVEDEQPRETVLMVRDVYNSVVRLAARAATAAVQRDLAHGRKAVSQDSFDPRSASVRTSWHWLAVLGSRRRAALRHGAVETQIFVLLSLYKESNRLCLD